MKRLRGLVTACMIALALAAVSGCASTPAIVAPLHDAAHDPQINLFRDFDVRSTHFSVADAYRLQLSIYAMDQGSFKLARSLDRWAIPLVREFYDRESSIHGYIAANDAMVLLVFSGTDFLNLNDWKSNFDGDPDSESKFKSKPEELVHRGFSSSLAWFSDDIESQIESIANAHNTHKPVWITGHSRGGAFAILAANRLAARNTVRVAGVYTFGQPCTGSDGYFAALQSKNIAAFRIVNHGDPIPHVPIYFAKHADDKVIFLTPGKLTEDVPLSDAWTLWTDLDDHYQTAYLSALFKLLPAEEQSRFPGPTDLPDVAHGKP